MNNDTAMSWATNLPAYKPLPSTSGEVALCLSGRLATEVHHRNLRSLFEALEHLKHLPPSDPDLMNPTPGAYQRAVKILNGVVPYLKEGVPKGFVAPDGDGGIRVRWRQAGRELKLIIPDHDETYIYHADSGKYAVEKTEDPLRLVMWLKWYNSSSK